MPKLRVAMIGLGMAAKPHARALMDLADRVEVAHAVSPSATGRAAFAADYPFPTTASTDEALADPGVDAAIVLTPANTHHDVAVRCAEAGKHVLLEKPLEVTPARARDLVGRLRALDRRLGIVLQLRFTEEVQALRRRLADADAGALASAALSVRWWRPQAYYDEPGRGTLARDGGGVLMTQAIHWIDLMLHLAGPVAEVTAFAGTSRHHRMEAEDAVGAGLRFANGAIGTLDATTAAFPGFPARLEMVFERATAVLRPGGFEIHHGDGTVDAWDSPGAAHGGGADPMAYDHGAHRALIADFLDAVAAGRDPGVTGEEALRAHRLIEALLESSAAGRPVRV